MIEHVYRRVAAARGLSAVVVATDDLRIATRVHDFGGKVRLTKATHATGTDRLAEVVATMDCDVVVNVQGDEPLIDPEVVSRVAEHLMTHPDDPVVTLAAPLDPAERDNPNAVKVVLSLAGYALYFSRSPIPFEQQEGGARPLKHLGLYGYRSEALERLASLPPTPLERSESLEQLRALENGIPIRVLRVETASPGVDTREDLERVERLLGA